MEGAIYCYEGVVAIDNYSLEKKYYGFDFFVTMYFFIFKLDKRVR